MVRISKILKQVANAFNNVFVNAANTVNKDIPLTFKSPNDYLKNTNPQSLFLYPVTKLEIENNIDSLNSSKASGPFIIPIKLLKLLRSIVSDPICLLINDYFLRGQFPDKLKLAKTMPLHKKGSTLNMNNYQPISLLSVFSKIYEKIMYARLYQFLEKSELFYSLQFGFRAKHSTNHALIRRPLRNQLTITNLDVEYFWISGKHLIESTISFYLKNFSTMV